MDLFFYVVIIIIVVLKIIFWVFYFYSRYKRKEIQRLISQASTRDLAQNCYEEQPTTPQPAFMFSQDHQARGAYPMNLPAYAEEDPGKIEYAPPPYIPESEECHPVVMRDIPEHGDTVPLLSNEEQPPSPFT